MAVNLATKYSPKVDERFYAESQAQMGTNKEYEWEGVDTVKVYQVDTVPMNDYTRSGVNRYSHRTGQHCPDHADQARPFLHVHDRQGQPHTDHDGHGGR